MTGAVKPWFGIVADDVTGATDVATFLVDEGVPTAMFFGLPEQDSPMPDAECLVIALKTRSIPADEAVDQSVRAARILLDQGVRTLYFKYCSTFDSTERGNIGPVAAALADLVDCPVTLVAPSAPRNGRTVYQGHLFVGSQLLSDSPMRHHPINPMTDANLVRVLQAQTDRHVGLLARPDVLAGDTALRARIAAEPAGTLLVADSITDDDMLALGRVALDLPLVSGSAGLAHAMGRAFSGGATVPPPELPDGPYAVISGSCSAATLGQVDRHRAGHPSYLVDPLRIAAGDDIVAEARAFLTAHLHAKPMIYSSADAAEVAAAQATLGVERAARLVEETLAACAEVAVDLGVRRLLVAGGETSGAVVTRLGVGVVHIGPPIDPGVCWSVDAGDTPLALVLKSGNFGGPDLFERAAAGHGV